MRTNGFIYIILISFIVFSLPEYSRAQCRGYSFGSVSSTEFSEKDYYSEIFSSNTISDLKKLERLINEGDAEFQKLKKNETEIVELRKKAENESGRWAKRRLYSDIDKKNSYILKTKIEIYNKYSQARTQKYAIYSKHIDEVRYKNRRSSGYREAADYEYKAKADFKRAGQFRRTADGKPKDELLKDLADADSLYISTNENMEKAFASYYNDSPSKRLKALNEREEYEKYRAELNKKYQSEIEALLKGEKPEYWMRNINSEYDSYKNYQKQVKEAEKEIKKFEKEIALLRTQPKTEKKIKNIEYRIERLNRDIKNNKTYAERYENKVVEQLNLKIRSDKKSNQKKFESYNEAFGKLNRNSSNNEDLRKIEKAEEEILKSLNTAKELIFRAEFSNQCAEAKQKIYSLLLQANYHQAEAMDKLVAVQRDYGGLFIADITILGSSCNVSFENGISKKKTAGTKKSSTGRKYSGSKSKTYGKTKNWRVSNKKGITYKVQIMAQTEIPPSSAFKGLYPISSEILGGSTLTAYLVGKTSSMYTADRTLKKAKAKGFKDAYIVAYNKKGKRIPLWEAEDIIMGVKQQTTNSRSKTTVTENTQTEKTVDTKSLYARGIIFTVQLAYVNTKPSPKDLLYLQPIYEYKTTNGFSKYSVGIYRDYQAAEAVCKRVIAKGISDAFVAAYENGMPIKLIDAINKTKRSNN